MTENSNKYDSLQLLDKLIKPKTKKENRSTILLKDPDDDYSIEWNFIVPVCFNRALDIFLTERKKNKKAVFMWTQGTTFAFDIGDVLYFNSNISDLDLNQKHYIQVQNATSATPGDKHKNRDPGYVYFWETIYNIEKKEILLRKNLTMTQDDFVRYLIIGH
jgi:hypothetical protein